MASVQPSEIPAYQQPFSQVLTALGADARRGLTDGEARVRLGRHGKNELTADTPVPSWRKFLAQFQDVLVVLLLVATAISAALWLYERDSALPYEALAISAVVLLNALMGYIQESRAESALAALRQMAAAHADVLRDGERRSVDATEVVPGDIILIEEGDTIPADARLIHTAALQTAEAPLTGESLPVAKEVAPISGEMGLGDRDNMIFSGTAVTYGRGRAVVVATGMRTEMGRIAGMLRRRSGPANAIAEGTRPRRQNAGDCRGRDRRRHDRDDHPGRGRQRSLSHLSTCSSSAWPSPWRRFRRDCRQS